jgi:hypothetical protein
VRRRNGPAIKKRGDKAVITDDDWEAAEMEEVQKEEGGKSDGYGRGEAGRSLTSPRPSRKKQCLLEQRPCPWLSLETGLTAVIENDVDERWGDICRAGARDYDEARLG